MGYGEQIVGDLDDIMEELSGYGEEIVGDEGSELDALLGAVAAASARAGRRPAPTQRANLAQALARLAGQKGLQPVRNTQLRRYPLGLGATTIGIGATAIISANPQLPFQVQRLVTPSTGLLIDALAVGTVSQFVAAGSVPVEIFAPDAVDVDLKGDTAVPGVSIQITVSNPTAGALVFKGAIIGSVAQ